MGQSIQTVIGPIVLVFLTACATGTNEFANPGSNDRFRVSCPFSYGDTVANVQEYYEIDDEPEKLYAPKGPAYQYRFNEYGVWVFFDKDQRIESIRLNEPFKGSVRGVRVGDVISKSQRINGEPDSKFQFGLGSGRWTYNFGRNDFLSIDFNSDTDLIEVFFTSDCA